MSTIEFLHAVRDLELNQTLVEINLRCASGSKKLLEIGAGTGHQAKLLTQFGYDVTAIDLHTSAYREDRVHPVTEYDGKHIPCESHSIDIAFSSNVLEHICDIDNFLDEINRILKSDGYCFHILPTASTRFWSIISYYAWLLKRIIQIVLQKLGAINPKPQSKKIYIPHNSNQLFKLLAPPRHGERGNLLTEIYFFSESWWVKKFESRSYIVEEVIPNRLFYTMSNVFGFIIPLTARKLLAYFLGSSCKIYILRKNQNYKEINPV